MALPLLAIGAGLASGGLGYYMGKQQRKPSQMKTYSQLGGISSLKEIGETPGYLEEIQKMI